MTTKQTTASEELNRIGVIARKQAAADYGVQSDALTALHLIAQLTDALRAILSESSVVAVADGGEGGETQRPWLCTCWSEAVNAYLHHRSTEGACSCASHPESERCDCPYCTLILKVAPPAEPPAAKLPEGYTVPEEWEWAGETTAGEKMLAGLKDALADSEREAVRLRRELSLHREKAEGNYWAWQGDGEDHLETLTCPVVIHPSELRRVAAEARAEGERKERERCAVSAEKNGLLWFAAALRADAGEGVRHG
jgi:hypothetical protein